MVELLRQCNSAADQMVIRFYARDVFGHTLYYPVDYVEQYQKLTGQKTITYRTRCALERMGYTFVEVLRSAGK